MISLQDLFGSRPILRTSGVKAGDALTQGDAFAYPSVYWEYLSDSRDLRLPELMHPITYVNHEVRISQEMHRMYAALAQWGGFLLNQDQLNSTATYLGMEPSVFVQFEVEQSQAESRFWDFLARNAEPGNLSMLALAPEAIVPELVENPGEALAASDETPLLSATPEQNQGQEQAQQDSAPEPEQQKDSEPDVLLAHWMQDAASSADATPRASAMATSESFREQLLSNASTLPSQALTQ